MFRAYLASLGRAHHDEAVAAARARVCRHVRAHWDSLRAFFEDDRPERVSPDAYERLMRGNAWGGELELAALASVDGTHIRVYDARRRRWMREYGPRQGRAVGRAFLRYSGNHYDAICVR